MRLQRPSSADGTTISLPAELEGPENYPCGAGNSAWRMVRKHLDRVTAAVNAATPGSYAEVDIPFE
jgi:hypothetical protein